MRNKIKFTVLCAALLAAGMYTAECVAKTVTFINKTDDSFWMHMKTKSDKVKYVSWSAAYSIRLNPHTIGTYEMADWTFMPLQPIELRGQKVITPKNLQLFIKQILDAPDNTTFEVTTTRDDIILTPVSQ